MLGFTSIANWYRSAHSLGNELDLKIKKAEEEIRAEWNALVSRVEALERNLFGHQSVDVTAEPVVPGGPVEVLPAQPPAAQPPADEPAQPAG